MTGDAPSRPGHLSERAPEQVTQVRARVPGVEEEAATRRLELSRIAAFYKKLLTGPDAIMVTDENARILEVNARFTALYGYRAEEVIGQTPKVLQSGRHSPDLYKAMREALADPGQGAWTGEVVDRALDGKEIHVELTIMSVKDERGQLFGYIGRTRDISERVAAAAAIAERDRELVAKNAELERLSAFKTELMAITSHDLKAPLGAIKRLAETLLAAAPEATRAAMEPELERIVGEGKRLLRLVDDMLDLQRAEAGAMRLSRRLVRVDALARAIAGELDAGRTPRIRVTCAGDPGVAVLDPDRIGQVLENLLANAEKFGPPQAPIDLACWATADEVSFEVADRGAGIPEAERARMFRPYAQMQALGTRTRGAGLGLSIVQHLVTLHRGTVAVQDRPGGGSVFRVALPRRWEGEAEPRKNVLILGGAEREVASVRATFAAASVLTASTALEIERACALEVPSVVVVLDAGALTAAARDSIARARLAGAMVAVVRAEAELAAEEPFDVVVERPVVDVELAPLVRKVRRG
jgi:PAS domain S-box-containing protein